MLLDEANRLPPNRWPAPRRQGVNKNKVCVGLDGAFWLPTLDAGPGAVGGATSAGDSPLHLAAHAFRKSISPAAPHLLDVLVSAAPDSAARAVRQRGKASKTPLEWLPRGDARYGLCEELLSHKVARCLELLLEHHGDAASHVLPETGELALHQVCAITPPVATVRMLVALLANHAPAAATPRKSDGKTPLHLLCRAVTVDRDHYVPPPRADGDDGEPTTHRVGIKNGLRDEGISFSRHRLCLRSYS